MVTKKLCQYFYYAQNDLTGLRVGDWKMSFAVKEDGLWWDRLVYPRVPYIFYLRSKRTCGPT